MINFATLGPAGSNHEFVVRKYLAFHAIENQAAIGFFRDFEEGAAQVLSGAADFMVQCAVHPATTDTVAKYLDGLYVVDTFISPSRNLAIVKNRAADAPTTLAVMRPTMSYTDMTKWPSHVVESTVMGVEQGLLDGRYEIGLTYVSLVERFPERFSVEEYIGTVDDAWIVYGRQRISNGALVAWPQSPAAAMYREMSASRP